MDNKNTIIRIFRSVANLQEKPGDHNHIGRRDSQLLHGEEFEVLSIADGWAFGRSLLDNYTGYLRLTDIDGRTITPTHVVSTIHTNAYPRPDFKTRPSLTLGFMSRVAVNPARMQDGFIALKGFTDTWVPETHLITLKDLDRQKVDIVETALMFSGMPYVYGGRTAQGIDCSGLVQLALQRNGLPCPRDADQQQNMVGYAVKPGDPLRRGDLVYFPGHVGIMVDEHNILNATVRHMKVVTEKLADILPHYGAADKAILVVRRLAP